MEQTRDRSGSGVLFKSAVQRLNHSNNFYTLKEVIGHVSRLKKNMNALSSAAIITNYNR